MIHITRTTEPDFWTEYKRRNPRVRYDDLQNTEEGKELRRKLKEYNILQQKGLCAYCCKRITMKDSLNEHIKPRGLPLCAKYSMEYDNIVACCNTNDTCSAHKENKYNSALFVSPLDDDCEEIFEYYENGEIVSDSDRGTYTIGLLNLNSYKLRQARKARLKGCSSLGDDLVRKLYIEPNEEGLCEPFADIVRYFYC